MKVQPKSHFLRGNGQKWVREPNPFSDINGYLNLLCGDHSRQRGTTQSLVPVPGQHVQGPCTAWVNFLFLRTFGDGFTLRTVAAHLASTGGPILSENSVGIPTKIYYFSYTRRCLFVTRSFVRMAHTLVRFSSKTFLHL